MIISKPQSEQWLGKKADNTFENYQLNEYRQAISKVKNFRTAIDLGANLGVMSYRMVKDFQVVHAFEPLFHEHLSKNVVASNLHVYPFAVGDTKKTETMRVGLYHSGGSNITSEKQRSQTYQQVTVVPIDSFEFEDVDFIKIDVEDYEMFALRGAIATIEKCKPTMLVELKTTNPYYKEILNFMNSFGYTREIVGELDSVFYW